MPALTRRIAAAFRGRGHAAALEALAADLRALQQKVATVEQRLDSLEAGAESLHQTQLDGFDRVRDAVAEAVDDLGARIATVHARLSEEPGSPR